MFTRRGDTGETDTGLRKRVGKASPLVEFEGTLDEAISFIGNALVITRWDDVRQDLLAAQEDLYALGEDVSAEGKGRTIKPDRVDWLEQRSREYKAEIGKVRLFVVPGGSVEATSMHIARTVTRRLERLAVYLSTEMELNRFVMIYLNRLSSLLFMTALVSNRRLGIEERIWDIRRES